MFPKVLFSYYVTWIFPEGFHLRQLSFPVIIIGSCFSFCFGKAGLGSHERKVVNLKSYLEKDLEIIMQMIKK